MKRKPKSRKLTMLVFHGDRRMDNLMHRCDLFEPFKAYAQPHLYTVTLKPRCTIKRAIKDVKTILEKCDQTVVCIVIPGRKEQYRDPNILSVSNGLKWAVLDQVLHVIKTNPTEVLNQFFLFSKPIQTL